ncbi:hypothetical protein DPMN_145842 [Dreissena polymorpha]|uniref:Uncharacterized protein n=1 Tax=Dreissena polymorpha TaxID=45954 RepID=A0A9D4J1K1_DREPO|nr:hypothetical protein DPMN_145842 [Dreissena polymorpha]
MPVASRQSAGLPMYRSFTGTLPAFTGAPHRHHRRQPVRCRSSAGVCTVELRCRPGYSRYRPGCSRCRDGDDSRFIPEILNSLILTRFSSG